MPFAATRSALLRTRRRVFDGFLCECHPKCVTALVINVGFLKPTLAYRSAPELWRGRDASFLALLFLVHFPHHRLHLGACVLEGIAILPERHHHDIERVLHLVACVLEAKAILPNCLEHELNVKRVRHPWIPSRGEPPLSFYVAEAVMPEPATTERSRFHNRLLVPLTRRARG